MFAFVEGGRYLVRDLMNVSVSDIRKAPEAADIILVFDDGEIHSTSRECVHARYCWELYTVFPFQFVSKKHHIHAFKRIMKPDVDGEILNAIMWDCVRVSREQGWEMNIEPACKKIYDITDQLDQLYRDLVEYAVSVDSMDFVNLQHHPEIAAANAALWEKENVIPNDIARVYGIVDRVVRSPATLSNHVAMYAYYGSVKIGQLYKCVAPYGFITDVDSVIFKRHPILDSLVTGLTHIRDLLMESRTASMSIWYQKHAMQHSEYLTRQLQLNGENMYRVHKNTDCGTRRYIDMYLETREDLSDIAGSWYLDPETQELRCITGKEFHLLQRVVKVRTVLHCRLPDRYGVCSTCYGRISDSIFDTDNIGHIAATVLQELVTQSILSNKHLVASASSETVKLSSDEQQYLKAKGDESTLYFNIGLKDRRVSIIFAEEDAKRLKDIEYIEDLSAASPARLTKLTELVFRVYSGDTIQREFPVRVSTKSQNGYFTIEMLGYLRTHKWRIDGRGCYEVFLDNWDYTNPVITLPAVQYSTPAHMLAVKEFLTTSDSKEKKATLTKFTNPSAALLAFQDLIKQRLRVNFTHLQVIMLSYLAQDPKNFDYRIPKVKSDGKLVPYREAMVMRDFALAMSYEKHYDTFRDIRSYIVDHRHPHPHANALRG